MQTIELLHANGYSGVGFEGVRFPAKVKAQPYRFGTNSEYTLDGLMCVPNEELLRVGYNGPLLDGGLHFAQCDHSWRKVNPFAFWNALKASRNVGALPA